MEIDLTHFSDPSNLTKLFIRILKENRAYNGYFRNLKQYNKANGRAKKCFLTHGVNGNFADAFIKENHEISGNLNMLAHLLTNSFYWAETKEGDNFWRDIYNHLRHLFYLPHNLSYGEFKKHFKYD
jgi:hypothetical protein